jgi:HEAT repeat protein
VDPHGFLVGDAEVGAGQGQVVALAESLHSMQIGQLVVVPGITQAETQQFVALAVKDPAEVRQLGGPRNALVNGGVTHLAVIELTLRASEEGGLLGIDLATASLDEIAAEMAAAAERRAREAESGPAYDEMAAAVDRLEEATRELATERMAAALMRLDENTRSRVLAMSLKSDTQGQRMEGMLAIIARMKPAALARLLTLVATQANADPQRIASAISLPPETARLLQMLLAPTPMADIETAAPASVQAAEIAQVMATETDTGDIDRQVAVASPALSSGRALATATAVSRRHPDTESVRAIGEVLPQAARDGSFPTVREALRRLDELSSDPALVDALTAARATLSDPKILTDVCEAPLTDADAAIAGEILHAAGPAGAYALLDSYVRAPEAKRSLLKPVLRGMSEGVLGAARQRLRTANPQLAAKILGVLAELGDARAVPLVAQAVDHLDEQVRFAAVSALVQMQTPQATTALVKAINHREPETQRYVVREIGRARVAEAVPALSRALEDINVFHRTYETRKQIVVSLEQIGTPEAEKALRRFAQRTLGVGRKTRELRKQAVSAAEGLAKKRGVSAS